MNMLNKSQLAWLLGIKTKDARDKMVYCWCKENNKVPRRWKEVYQLKKDEGHFDYFPEYMPIDLIARNQNLPNLQEMVDEVTENYFKRAATRSWIMDYPQTRLDKAEKTGANVRKISIPTNPKSFLTPETQAQIIAAWQERYKAYDVVFA